MGREEIGKVFNYYSKAGVAAIQMASGELHIGDTIQIEGGSSSITMEIESMQIEHQQVTAAAAGQSVGIKVPQRVHPGDRVYKIEPSP